MDLLSWIIIGVVINLVLLKDELLNKKETILAGLILIIIRSVSGGVLSNYIFSDGIGAMDFSTFSLVGILPLIFLYVAKIMNKDSQRNDHKNKIIFS